MLYEYRCEECNHTFERVLSFDDREIPLNELCPECGVEFTDIMSNQLNKEGYAYCTFCGEKFESPATTAAES